MLPFICIKEYNEHIASLLINCISCYPFMRCGSVGIKKLLSPLFLYLAKRHYADETKMILFFFIEYIPPNKDSGVTGKQSVTILLGSFV